MVAPVAIQMGGFVARNIKGQLRGQPLEPFRYRDQGTLATIGRNAAVANVYGIKATGFVAWVMWLRIYIIQLIGFRHKLFLLIQLGWGYFFFRSAARLVNPHFTRNKPVQ